MSKKLSKAKYDNEISTQISINVDRVDCLKNSELVSLSKQQVKLFSESSLLANLTIENSHADELAQI